MVGVLIVISLEKRSVDNQQDIKISNLSEAVELLNKKVSDIKTIKGADGKTPVKGIDYFDGKDGQDGKDGKDGANGVNGVDGTDGNSGKNGVNGEPARELLIDCIASKIMKKYDGDGIWQPTNIKCERTDE